jgi:hypothetical protein
MLHISLQVLPFINPHQEDVTARPVPFPGLATVPCQSHVIL